MSLTEVDRHEGKESKTKKSQDNSAQGQTV